MAKSSLQFICSQCGYRPPKWVGCCPECKEWDCIEEHAAQKKTLSSQKALFLTALDTMPLTTTTRLLSGIGEWDRVMGGGIIPGSFLLLSGDPGIGKSTLLLHIAHTIAQEHSVVYISSEESLAQIKLRAERINCVSPNLLCADQGDLLEIIRLAQEYKPTVLIIDSIQNCFITDSQHTPGSMGFMREAGFQLMQLAKQHTITVIITGHITKEGIVAGPKMLEHIVDGVFYLQGEDRWQTRMLRSVKNRFGTIAELGFFHMGGQGLREMPNINEYLLSEISHAPGSAIVSIVEGSRPILIEVQSLAIPTKYGTAQRVITGADHKQVMLIAAILEKYLKIPFSSHDIFFKVGAGFKIKESSADLGIALSLLSSYFQQPLTHHSLALAELSLTGTIKAINHAQLHIKEARKFGIQTVLLSSKQKTNAETFGNIKQFSSVYDLLTLFDES